MVMNNAHSLLGVLVGPCCCMHGVASVHVYAHARTHTCTLHSAMQSPLTLSKAFLHQSLPFAPLKRPVRSTCSGVCDACCCDPAPKECCEDTDECKTRWGKWDPEECCDPTLMPLSAPVSYESRSISDSEMGRQRPILAKNAGQSLLTRRGSKVGTGRRGQKRTGREAPMG